MASARRIVWVERGIWVLIYIGLLTGVLGLASRASHAPTGWTLIALGSVLVIAGVVLIWLRSRMRVDLPGIGPSVVSAPKSQGKT